MMSPNKANIDQWLFDYFEGNLNPGQEEMLEQFLMDHPEYDADMEAWGGARAASGVDTYQNSERLKRRVAIVPLFTRWAAVFILLLSFGTGLYYVNNLKSDVKYYFVPLSDTYFSTDSGLSLVSVEQKEEETNEVEQDSRGQYLLVEHAENTSEVNNSMSSNNMEAATTSRSDNYAGSSAPVAEPVIINALEIDEVPDQIAATLKEPPVQIVVNKDAGEETPVHEKENTKSKGGAFKDFSRSVKRIIHSEIGLINLRDPNYLLPGNIANDINFGHTGSLLATRVYSNTILQWPGRTGQTVSMQAGFDTYASSLGGGIGVQMNYSNYEAGMFESYEGAITYSPKFKLSKNIVLEPALRFKMGTRSLNPDRIVPGTEVEWERGNRTTLFPDGEKPNGERIFYKDMGLGVLLNTKWAYVGLNVDNILRHANPIYVNPGAGGDNRAKLNFTATAGTDYESFNKKTSLSTYLLYRNYGDVNEGWLGMNYRYRFMTVGAAISTNADPVASIGLSFDRFRLVYFADYSKNSLKGKRMLSHQLSLRFTSKPNKNSRKLMY